ncbi:MAG: bifunctional phosphopantothenoylcysteine decarboxylase/phosphopantothenate--cysteine ligase CoaBC [Candidatus Diapherotrites archaeon]|uniref:Coenzyme A biosynthesis bifunctional protein CoaBC n=1 Tax=Candidatus Iainarchaeum sp. TaxID=3101447 RepID=A0A2D6LPW4_9ARCH|nr:bifunctional phosphopantothenoylcysteine decarboxylase/phosphopantothenate--cysteine ligase CoaBC [Candidatus Diapherotrites archaeon]|tara:strand:+ start:1765 stop:2868 length:1104 start_codon:yes stop_codon:yes gene_type:complete
MKTIVLGICGSIAAIRAFDLVRVLRKKGFSVQVLMSKGAEGIITKDAMEWASGNSVITQITGKVEHVKFFGKKGKADLMIIAPATANTISKIAMAIDDTPITTFATIAIGSKKPVLIAPAMHEPMYEHPIVQKNLELLEKEKRIKIIEPLVEEEKAKLAPVEKIVLEVEKALGKKKLEGKKILLGNGATYSQIDPMRIITNLSSGKMGKALEHELLLNGATVSLVEGTEHEKFYSEIMKELPKADYFVLPAAINDFEAKEQKNKIPSSKKINLELVPAKKLLSEVREKFPELKIIAFKAETNKSKKELGKIGKEFLKKNKLQMVVVNDVSKNPTGSDKSEMLIVSREKTVFVKGTKEKIAGKIVSLI